MDSTLAQKYDRAVPRYTSYPTAAQFHTGIGPSDLCDWLGQQGGRRLGLYVHVPFCHRLCFYCACHTAVVNRDGPLDAYAEAVAAEAARLGPALPEEVTWAARQWGGGTPTRLGPQRLLALSRQLDRLFPLAAGAEHAVEIDPRRFDSERADALAAMKVTRVSLGVQDFAQSVQRAINREQSPEMTAAAIDLLRRRGITAVNLDLVYGLPRQTLESLDWTLSGALSLAPSRFAVFGYAHVPWMKPHQRLIDERALPGAEERVDMARLVEQRLVAAGYRRVGLDHYARPDDPMAGAARAGRLSRSFQGYSDLGLDGTVGLGASAITSLPEGFAQNHAATPDYLAAIGMGGLATGRGVGRDSEDRLRGAVIERLLCDFEVDLDEVPNGAALMPDEASLADFVGDGLLERDGRRLAMTPAGRPWVRAVAALFDSYHRPTEGRHARAV